MESGALVALRLAHGVLGLAGTELAEVLGRPGHYILEELKGDSAEWLTCQGVLFVRIVVVTMTVTIVVLSGAVSAVREYKGKQGLRHIT